MTHLIVITVGDVCENPASQLSGVASHADIHPPSVHHMPDGSA